MQQIWYNLILMQQQIWSLDTALLADRFDHLVQVCDWTIDLPTGYNLMIGTTNLIISHVVDA